MNSVNSFSPSEATAPKLITAAELREYLHLPAKDVAKELGMCLTSLKKVCRQHGILRWPYRRLKMIDRKIQSLEHHIAEGTEDEDDVRRQLEKLHSERASLPCNYGSSGAVSEAESDPSSPLSCASTTVPPHDPFAPEPSPTPCHATDAHAPPCQSPVECEALGDLPFPPAPRPAPCAAAPMTAAAALISSLPSPPPHHQPPPNPAATPPAAAGGKECRQEGTVRVEVALPAEVAAEVARGAQLVVRHEAGTATLHVIPRHAPASSLPLHHPLLPGGAPAPAEAEAGSDADMIAALVGCAAEKAWQEAADGQEADGGELSDEALALALAGCAGAAGPRVEEGAGAHEHCHELALADAELPEWYPDEGPHELDMALFDHDA